MATGQDPRFTISPNLEEYFVDKDTGLALAAGVVTYYEDNSRTVLKNIYTISGSPPNYTYTVLPNPNTLSAAGYPTDANGNNVRVYYFPFDGTPDNTTNTIDLYYITVYSSGGVLQFTREGWPDVTTSSASEDNANVNLIPNGQFLLHNTIVDANGQNIGRITTNAQTAIAPGGWYFEKSATPNSTDIVTFNRFGSITENPSANPRYFITIQNTTPGSDTIKYLSVRFPNVNMFASDTQTYTYAFTGKDDNNAGSNVSVEINKYFGAGGSTVLPVEVANFTLTGTDAIYSTSFVFGVNDGLTLGTDDTDYVEVVLSLPVGVTFQISATDFLLLPGTLTVEDYPYQTNAVVIADSEFGFLPPPNPNGSNFFLPTVLTSTGATYDSSEIGDIIATTRAVPVSPLSISPLPISNRAYCDGSNFLYNGYSALGIPFSRLGDIYWDNTNHVFIYGSGKHFVTTYPLSISTSQIYWTTNSFGASTAPANGVSSPGFTYYPVTTSSSTGYFANASVTGVSQNEVIIQNTLPRFVTATSAATSGFTVATYQNPASLSDTTTNQTASFAISSVLTVNGASLHVASGNAKYFEFTIYNGSTTITYYVWYVVGGTGIDPAPGGGAIGIEVQLPNTTAYTATDVAFATASAINGELSTIISTVSGASIPEGSYLTFNGNDGNTYATWYTQLSNSLPPVVGGITTFIKVSYTTGDSAATIATNTLIAINKTYLAVPDFRGVFLRGTDSTMSWDLDSAVRFGLPYNIFGNRVGTFELSQLISHNHFGNGNPADPSFFPVQLALATAFTGTFLSGSAVNTGTTTVTQMPLTISYDGGTENRPVNASVNYVVKY